MSKILVIDDNRNNLTLLKILLKRYYPDYDILTSQSGPEGIEIAKNELPDAIILDIRMPDMDGYEVCKHLQSDESTRYIPVILLTAYGANSKDIVRGLEMGAVSFIPKPINNDELIARVNVVLRMKYTEDKLKESEEKYRNIFESANDAIIYLGRSGKILDVNEKTVEISGWKREELVGKNFTKLRVFGKENISAVMKTFKKALTKEKFNLDFSFTNKKGIKIDLECAVTRIKQAGKTISLTIVARNVTDRIQAEEALKQKVLELNSFINNIPDMAWLKDTDSNFIAVNKMFCDTVSMDQEYLVNHTCEVCFGKEAAKKFKEDEKKVMKGKKQIIIEESIIDSKKNKVWLETIKSPILDKSGEITGTVGLARDITERKKMEEELKKKMNQLERFNRLTVGRELRMIEMKKEVNELLEKAGMEKRYSTPG